MSVLWWVRCSLADHQPFQVAQAKIAAEELLAAQEEKDALREARLAEEVVPQNTPHLSKCFLSQESPSQHRTFPDTFLTMRALSRHLSNDACPFTHLLTPFNPSQDAAEEVIRLAEYEAVKAEQAAIDARRKAEYDQAVAGAHDNAYAAIFKASGLPAKPESSEIVAQAAQIETAMPIARGDLQRHLDDNDDARTTHTTHTSASEDDMIETARAFMKLVDFARSCGTRCIMVSGVVAIGVVFAWMLFLSTAKMAPGFFKVILTSVREADSARVEGQNEF